MYDFLVIAHMASTFDSRRLLLTEAHDRKTKIKTYARKLDEILVVVLERYALPPWKRRSGRQIVSSPLELDFV
jgi:hypothetical protein